MAKKIIQIIGLSTALTAQSSLAQLPNEIRGINVQGNERVSLETVRSYLTLDQGDALTQQAIQESIRKLYATDFFQDIAISIDEEGVLQIQVQERPSIAEVRFEGNELIKTEDMQQAMETLGIKQGRIFNEAQMERIIVDLKRRYQNQGYYAADVDVTVETLPRNRVALSVDIVENEPASIGQIQFVGNHAFGDELLKRRMLLSESSTFGDSDKYAKPKLQSDLETLRSYYLDRGFAKFDVRSSQVSLSPDKTEVFITVNMDEGNQYRVSDVRYSGETIVSETELDVLKEIEEGMLFSRSKVVASVEAFRNRLSEEGYAFAEIEPITKLDETERTVSLDFRIEPKSRVYVRRISIEGNTRTQDHVIRRELRQLESAPYSLQAVKRSKTRLNQLGYFTKANIETDRVSDNQVDLIVQVEEESTGSFNAGVGYSQLDGVSFQIGVTERNVIGSGYRANINANYSASIKSSNISLTNPYFTEDGMSLGGGFYFRNIDAEELNVSNYKVDTYGVRTNIGYPTSEYSRLNYGLKFDNQSIECISDFQACDRFVEDMGEDFQSVRVTAGWTYDTKNSFYFPTDGHDTSVSTEVVIPTNSDLSFYKIFLKENAYFPLTDDFTLKLKGDVAYGDGYGNNQDSLPFFENFYAGGIGSVRGFEPNSLGPRYQTTDAVSDDPKGGSFRVVTNAEIIFPMPFIENSENLRVSFFVDAGNVYDSYDEVEFSSLRSAYGAAVSWITPVGPLAFSLARPLKSEDGDELQSFQFNLGIPM
ncbi:outer membrane protein assembly factor BamA [Thiomicrospira sp. WB1]|uniref:outer membrane protein assembly factor BamA n=1 Tax=Thiomicrospira sp. WB1 TaxID=1685380 RepID=UPI0007490472|nr:outer membrane protein assembly factor BamA [Thiomicrospira sp. WB1]KUJ72099.1 outer membrane protein assembly factor BamA [Thiomicrospira sp. WB1]